jgi:hypothetical protein
MSTVLLIGIGIIIGIAIGMLIGSETSDEVIERPSEKPNSDSDSIGAKPAKIESEELVEVIQTLFSGPEDEIERRLNFNQWRVRTEDGSKINEDSKDISFIIESCKDNILDALSAIPGMEDRFPRNKEEQLEEIVPEEISSEEKEICKKREEKTADFMVHGKSKYQILPINQTEEISAEEKEICKKREEKNVTKSKLEIFQDKEVTSIKKELDRIKKEQEEIVKTKEKEIMQKRDDRIKSEDK